MILAPKVKAKKLIAYYTELIQAFEVFEDELLLIILAKKCAEHSVYEILIVVEVKGDVDLFNYWSEVKQEIENFKI
jgi:hypothetical protein